MHRSKKAYILDQKYQQETKISCYTPGAQKLGFCAVHDQKQLRAFVDHRHPVTGEPLLRRQKNAPKWVYQIVFTCHPTVDAIYKGASKRDKRAIQEAVLRAGLTAVRWLEKQIAVGRGAGGKKLEPGELLGRLDVHDRTRNNDCSLHAHAVLLRAARAANGKTYAIRDRRVLYTNAAKARELYHLALTVELLSIGYNASLQNGKCVIPGIDYAAALTTRTRRQESLVRLQAAGYPAPTPLQVRMDLLINRPQKTAYDEEKLHGRWQKEHDRDTPGAEQKARRTWDEKVARVAEWLKAFLDENLTTPWRVIAAAVKKAWQHDPRDRQTIVIQSVDAFLFDTSKRSRIEGHRAALREVKWGTFSSLGETLKAAEKAYKAARRPRLELEKGARIIVPSWVEVTPEQLEKLLKRAGKLKATVQFQGKEAQECVRQRAEKQRAQVWTNPNTMHL